jgi:hypothetical protein
MPGRTWTDTQTLSLIPRLCNLISPRLWEKRLCFQTHTRRPLWALMSALATVRGSTAQRDGP